MTTKITAGSLRHAIKMWQRITTDQFILQTIQGYRLEFLAVPQQVVAPVTVVKGLTQQNVMQEEIEKLLLKGAIQLVSPSNGQFVSRLFLVPKKTGDLRPVINLRPLNKFIIRKHFKMENLQNVTQLVRKGDYMVTIDFKMLIFRFQFTSLIENFFVSVGGTSCSSLLLFLLALPVLQEYSRKF